MHTFRCQAPGATRVAILATVAMVVGCYGPVDDDIEMRGADFVPDDGSRDVHVLGADLGCPLDMPVVNSMRVGNVLGLMEQSLQVARDPLGGVYPVGTVLLGHPREIMVKRGTGFSPETNDWEFLFIDATPDGAVVLDRGTTEVSGLGGNCYECHKEAQPEFDFVCQQGQGCADNPFFRPVFMYSAQHDPRCESEGWAYDPT